MSITWKMPFDVAEKAYYFQQQLDNYEITEEEFREELAKLPGYPLKRLLRNGDDLKMLIQPKTVTSSVKPSKLIH